MLPPDVEALALVETVQLSPTPISDPGEIIDIQQSALSQPLISLEIGFNPVPIIEVDAGLTVDIDCATTLRLPHHSSVNALLTGVVDNLDVYVQKKSNTPRIRSAGPSTSAKSMARLEAIQDLKKFRVHLQ